jgi:hypothetical protein
VQQGSNYGAIGDRHRACRPTTGPRRRGGR